MKYKDKQSIAWQRREIEKGQTDMFEYATERKARRKFKRDLSEFSIKVCSKYDRIWWNSLTETIKENIFRDWRSLSFNVLYRKVNLDFDTFMKNARKENPATEKYRENKLKEIGID